VRCAVRGYLAGSPLASLRQRNRSRSRLWRSRRWRRWHRAVCVRSSPLGSCCHGSRGAGSSVSRAGRGTPGRASKRASDGSRGWCAGRRHVRREPFGRQSARLLGDLRYQADHLQGPPEVHQLEIVPCLVHLGSPAIGRQRLEDVLAAAEKAGVERLVCAGSAAVYRGSSEQNVTEESVTAEWRIGIGLPRGSGAGAALQHVDNYRYPDRTASSTTGAGPTRRLSPVRSQIDCCPGTATATLWLPIGAEDYLWRAGCGDRSQWCCTRLP
jgi:hypothetical protein